MAKRKTRRRRRPSNKGSSCSRYKRVRIKSGPQRGKMVRRCAKFK